MDIDICLFVFENIRGHFIPQPNLEETQLEKHIIRLVLERPGSTCNTIVNQCWTYLTQFKLYYIGHGHLRALSRGE